MTKDIINKCLTFSEGEGRTKDRIGAFGVGLPNSSISVCRRVEVYSKDEEDNWNFVFLDLDDQLKRSEPGYDPSIIKKPKLDKIIKIDKKIKVNKENFCLVVFFKKADRIAMTKSSLLVAIIFNTQSAS